MKFKNKFFIIILLILILLSVSVVSAAQNDTVVADDENGVLKFKEEEIQTQSEDIKIVSSSNENDVLSDDDELSYQELQDRINERNSGETLTLERDVRYNGDKGHMDITKTITIDGNGHYISGNGVAGVFRFDDAESGIKLTLKNLIMKDAWSDNGGVIHTKKNVDITIINCTFIDDGATEDGGAIYFDSTGELIIKDSTFERCLVKIVDSSSKKHNGGAINTHDGTITIDNCIFTNNTAGFGYGGAIYLQGECRGITNSVFENNLARSLFGGAIYVETDNENGVAIDNCRFTNNTSKAVDRKAGSGGAVYYDGSGLLRITNSNFTKNEVLGMANSNKNEREASMTAYMAKGGAVSSIHDIEIGNCIFIKNHAVDKGGAVNTEEGIRWILGPSVFISNTVGHSNVHLSNKGGAICAANFLNDANELIFIDNHGWYGGAIYLNNKNEITFESCVFINNSVWNNEGKDACGGAIYMDSSSSKVSLINNIFFNNHATDDRGVYNCGKYGTIKNNWYGINDVDFNDAYLLEWHRLSSNDKKSDSNSLRITLSANQTEVFESPVKLTLKFVCSDQTDFTGKLTNWNVNFASNNKGVFSDLQIGDNEATVIFTPEPGEHVVTAKVHNQEVSINLKQLGEFTWLQQQIDATPSGGVLNLNRNITYSHSAENDYGWGMSIKKPITINGNGHTINGLGIAKLFNVYSSDVTFNNITFLGGREFNYDGGAVHTAGETENLQIINCKFINNYANENGGGAILLYTENSKIINSTFINNVATQGGAIDIRRGNVLIDGCKFINNTAEDMINGGGAIINFGENVTISKSIFLNNKANIDYINESVTDTELTLTVTGFEDYINAIGSSKGITFSNVTYWDGTVTTGNNPVYSSNESGVNIILEVYNSKNQIVKKISLITDRKGQVKYDFLGLPVDNYTFKAYHPEDSYYAYYETEGNFNLTKTPLNKSEVKINIENGAEFYHNDCNISFDVTNRTDVEVLITSSDSSTVFFDDMTDLDYVVVNLPASDEDYIIFVYNWGNETHDPSSDYRSFKILKTNSTINVDPIIDTDYGNDTVISFTGDGDSYTIIVYDEDNNMVFNQTTTNKSIKIDDLDVGSYNVTVINNGNENTSASMYYTSFDVERTNNNFSVNVNDGVYGRETLISVRADADGEYNVNINSTNLVVVVVDGQGSTEIELGAGYYFANVTFNNHNYNNNASNTTFTIKKAQSNVGIADLGDIPVNSTKTIRFTDFYPVKYNVTIYNSGNDIVHSSITNSIIYEIPALDVGEYNLTVTNLGNANVTGSSSSAIFRVTSDNNVEITVEDADYGRGVFIVISADVDGYYTVDINGTEVTVEVVNGTGFDDSLLLNAGDYYANVTFANPYYNNNITNTTFTISQAESNLQIYEIGEVASGDDIVIDYYDDFPTVFNCIIYNEDGDEEFNVTFEYDDKSPEMSIIFSGLQPGEYLVVMENYGNENIIGSTDYMNFTVLPKLDIKITAGARTVKVDQNVTVNVKLNETEATGEVSVNINGIDYTGEVSEGAAAIIIPMLPADSYDLDVVYSGDERYGAANTNVKFNVNKHNVRIKATAVTVRVDQNATVKVAMSEDATGTVAITVDGVEYTGEISGGNASIVLPVLPAGSYVFDVVYSGDGKYKEYTTTVKFNSNKYYPTMKSTARSVHVGENVTVNVVMPDDANGTVSIKTNGTEYAGTVENGKGTIIIPDLSIGKYEFNVTYGGDDKYKVQTTKVTFNVNQANSAIKATARTVHVGENVTVNVALSDDATGDVVIEVNGNEYTAAVENGAAAVIIPNLPADSYTLDVTYSGDDKYKSRTAQVTFNVNKNNVRMKATARTVKVGNDVTVNVALSEDATGEVAIDVNDANYTATIENGAAVIVIFDLPADSYVLDVKYGGDDKYKPYTGSVKFNVNA